MNSLLQRLHAQSHPALPGQVAEAFPVLPVQLPGGSFSWAAVQLADELGAPVVVVTSSAARAGSLYRELLFFAGNRVHAPLHVMGFPAWDVAPFQVASPYGPLVADRLTTLFRLAQMRHAGPIRSGDAGAAARAVVVTTPQALMQRVTPAALLMRYVFSLSVGDQVDLPRLRTFLVEAGYHPVSQVEAPGEFAVRGGLIDLFPPEQADAVRIELFGDDVETIRSFDPVTQRSRDTLRQLRILPMCEVVLNEETIRTFRTNYRHQFGGESSGDDLYQRVSRGEKVRGVEQFLPLFHDQTETFFDYLPAGSLILADRDVVPAMEQWAAEIAEQAGVFGARRNPGCLPAAALYLSSEQLVTGLRGHPVLTVDPVPPLAPLATMPALDSGYVASPGFHDTSHDMQRAVMDRLVRHLEAIQRQGERVCVVLRTVGQKERLREILQDHRLATSDAGSWTEFVAGRAAQEVALAIGDVAHGFAEPARRWTLITEEEIFGPRVHRRRVDRRYLDQLLASFAALHEGDPVVHADYGIGRYMGLQSLTVDGVQHDFLLLLYADDAKLYVPVENLDRVSKFMAGGVQGEEGGEGVTLDRLGGTRWERTRQRVRRNIMEMAGELVRLQAERESQSGFACAPPERLYQEFAATFPFEETSDQIDAIQAVMDDMSAARPMDRLICGDVGFGKTEVALRAAFRAVVDGRQVAVLVPTTILAQQHYETFSRRMAAFPVRLDVLSRFRTPKQHRQTLAALAEGQIDIVIGTHRLLQSDVVFDNLGLLIVDEEQRFGVSHKERIKQMRATVDILTLTATPIPRTMHMAMSGLRDISIIASPPPDRMSVRTIVAQYDRQQVRDAILREIYRGGQVFYLFNRVDEIDRQASLLAEIVPEAKIGVAHGQMTEGVLEKVILSFYRQEFNVLLCTTIIENGIDIPTANTIIIHRADQFGLAQLHQLRGRVGRSRHRAYAYLLIPHPDALKEDARKRLEAIENFDDLGAGFMLATQDLEIRGAGNLLGAQQSGQIREVGFDLYTQMLQEAIQQLREQGEAMSDGVPAAAGADQDPPPAIQLHISTYIPEAYIADVQQRLTVYKRIAGAVTGEEIDAMKQELADRFGPLPPPVGHLLQLVEIRQQCQQLRIVRLEAGPVGGVVQFHATPRVDPGAVATLLQTGQGRYVFDAAKNTLALRQRSWQEEAQRIAEIRLLLAVLGGQVRPQELIAGGRGA